MAVPGVFPPLALIGHYFPPVRWWLWYMGQVRPQQDKWLAVGPPVDSHENKQHNIKTHF